MLILSPLKCQGTLFPFLQGWDYHKHLNRDLDEDTFDKNEHRKSLIGTV